MYTYVHGTTAVVLDDLVIGVEGTTTNDPGLRSSLVLLLWNGSVSATL